MPLTRSRDNLMDIEEPTNVSFTVNLDDDVSDRPLAQGGAIRKRPVSGARSSRKGVSNEDSRISRMIADSLSEFRGEMTQFISGELRSMIQGMNVGTRGDRNDLSNVAPLPNGNQPGLSTSSSNVVSAGLGSESPQEPFLAEKVLNIIRNWRLKFTGYDNQMSVDEFIYRVNILTSNNLRGDFELLCRHAHSLFEGKALEWYWRYHRQHDNIDWTTLTSALKRQYKVDYKDFDVLDDIRKRRQNSNENFDEYLDVISSMTDKLKNPISDMDLCEVLVRNLKTEIRHELLHLDITSVANLRCEVRKHEKFMKDLQVGDQRKFPKAKISELDVQGKDMDRLVETESNDVIYAVQHNVKCWNCDGTGHTFADCMEHRRVFCYGCGVKDTYKPNCPNCSRKSQGNGQKDVRRK